ncbi:hypothetical protein LTR80_011977 [Exophiala xenobiotica]|nr:hypothetical protein LTR14_011944 [Exophiala xenobiotica]
MMGLLMESVPTFYETWIECLGDLARYRMAIEEADMRDRENWSNVARMWYNRAADLSPTTGSMQHHLAILARPNVVRQLFYYTKALISGVPFVNARDSIMLLFTPFLDNFEVINQNYPKMETSLVRAAGIPFTHGSIHDYCGHITQFVSELDGTIDRTGSNFKVHGAEVASSLIAMVLDFGSDENFLWKAFCANSERIKQSHTEGQTDLPMDAVQIEDPTMKARIQWKFWTENGPIKPGFCQAVPPTSDRLGVKFSSSDEVTLYILPVWHTCVSIVAGKLKRYITYDIVSKEFASTGLASALPDVSLMNTLQVAAAINTRQDSSIVSEDDDNEPISAYDTARKTAGIVKATTAAETPSCTHYAEPTEAEAETTLPVHGVDDSQDTKGSDAGPDAAAVKVPTEDPATVELTEGVLDKIPGGENPINAIKRAPSKGPGTDEGVDEDGWTHAQRRKSRRRRNGDAETAPTVQMDMTSMFSRLFFG